MQSSIFMRALLFATTAAFFCHAQSSEANDTVITGFGSAFYAQANSKSLLPNNFSDTNPNFTNFSLFGLGVESKITDHWVAAAELLATGSTGGISSGFNLSAEWAYLTYKSDGGALVRAGRQRMPIFTASEYISEHYQLPFRVLPSIIYRAAPFSTFDGVSVSQSIETALGKVIVGIFGGTPIVDLSSTISSVSASNLLGAKVSLDGDGWKVRAQASRSQETINFSTPPTASYNVSNQQIYTVGYRYDKNNIVSWGEFLYRQSPGSVQGPKGFALRKSEGGYILAGYRIGKFMPRYTFSHIDTELGISNPDGTATSHVVGVNYEFEPKIIGKLEVQFDNVSAANSAYGYTVAAGSTATSSSSIYAGLDFGF